MLLVILRIRCDRDELTRQVRAAISASLPELAGHTDQIAEFYTDFHGIA